MRFLLKLEETEGKQVDINLDYRRRFISLLKHILGEEEVASRNPKPYTFAVYFGKEAKLKENLFTNVQKISFRFSTGDPQIGIKFYNGSLNFKKAKETISIGNGKFYIEWIGQEREKQITGSFQTLSPVVVERMGFTDLKDPNNRYITPNEDGFEHSLLENILRRYEAIKGKVPKINSFAFKPLNIKKEFVKHYGGYIKAFRGHFSIATDSQKVLEFIYKYGMGLRTGQGFGYLEVEDIPNE